jgi:hypothetical protein
MSNIFVSLHQELVIMISELSLWFSSTADYHSGHSVGPRRHKATTREMVATP